MTGTAAQRYVDRTLPDAAPGPLPPEAIYRALQLPRLELLSLYGHGSELYLRYKLAAAG